MEVTAVLLSWRRPWHIPEIVRHLRTVQQIDEIICWCNEHPPTPEIEALGVRVIHSPENVGVLGRILGAREAKHDHLFFQDDDLIPRNIDSLIAEYEANNRNCIVANLADDRSSVHWVWWQVHKPCYCELGFGSIVPRQFALSVLNWPYSHGLLQRKSDKILTTRFPWRSIRATEHDLTRLRHNGKESGRDEHALSGLPDHKALTAEAVALTQKWMESLA